MLESFIATDYLLKNINVRQEDSSQKKSAHVMVYSLLWWLLYLCDSGILWCIMDFERIMQVWWMLLSYLDISNRIHFILIVAIDSNNVFPKKSRECLIKPQYNVLNDHAWIFYSYRLFVKENVRLEDNSQNYAS